jgi:hypothetical protein
MPPEINFKIEVAWTETKIQAMRRPIRTTHGSA